MVMISKYIEIDSAHRIPDHHSKCRSVHGHRYKIEAVCLGEPADEGAQAGMAGGLDFAFLKEDMVSVIDIPCDHGMILSFADPIAANFIVPTLEKVALESGHKLNELSYITAVIEPFGKIYLMRDVPTAENLAKHWYIRLAFAIQKRQLPVNLCYVQVYETPTCWARYPVIAMLNK